MNNIFDTALWSQVDHLRKQMQRTLIEQEVQLTHEQGNHGFNFETVTISILKQWPQSKDERTPFGKYKTNKITGMRIRQEYHSNNR